MNLKEREKEKDLSTSTSSSTLITTTTTATQDCNNNIVEQDNFEFEEKMVIALQRHSEFLIDTVKWPTWRDFLSKLNETKQFRPLHPFPLKYADRLEKFVLVRECHQGLNDDHINPEKIRELRLAVIGNVDAGKSTMLGVLSRGGLDDGRGRARVHCARHRHESDTGRTSSVSQELLGFNIDGSHIYDERYMPSDSDHLGNGSTSNDPRLVPEYLQRHQKALWEAQIGRQGWKCISLIDLAGHERYLKTTMFGLTGFCPDVAMLMVGANTGALIGTSKEHLALAIALSIPVLVVLTKIDLAPEAIRDATLMQINKILKSPTCRKTPLLIRSMDDVAHVIGSGLFASNQLCPIFEVSNVTGQGVNLLREFMNLLTVPDDIRLKWEQSLAAPTEYQINETYTVPGVGTVVSGVVVSGQIKVGESLLLGPIDANGRFVQTVVRGIQRKRVNLSHAVAGQGVSLAIKKIKRADIRYGMVLTTNQVLNSSTSNPTLRTASSTSTVCREFTAQVVILYHSTTITSKYQAMLHCGTVRQTVQIISMSLDSNTAHLEDATTATTPDNNTLPTSTAVNVIGRSGDRAKIRFKFLKNPEVLHAGMKILFREGRTRGIGKIIELHQ